MPPNVTSWCYTYDCAVCNPNIKDDDTVFEYFDDDLPPLEDDPDTLSVGPPFYSDHQSLQNTTVHGTPQSNYKARPDNTTSQNNGYELVSLGIVNGFDQDDYPELRAIEVRDLGYEAEIQCSQLEYDLENNKIAFFFVECDDETLHYYSLMTNSVHEICDLGLLKLNDSNLMMAFKIDFVHGHTGKGFFSNRGGPLSDIGDIKSCLDLSDHSVFNKFESEYGYVAYTKGFPKNNPSHLASRRVLRQLIWYIRTCGNKGSPWKCEQ